MATIDDLQVALNAILAALETKPDLGDWGEPVDYSVILRQDQPGGLGQYMLEDLPIVANTILGRSGSGAIGAMDSGEIRNVIASDETNIGYVLKIDGSNTATWADIGGNGSDNVSFNNITASGNISASGDLETYRLKVGDNVAAGGFHGIAVDGVISASGDIWVDSLKDIYKNNPGTNNQVVWQSLNDISEHRIVFGRNGDGNHVTTSDSIRWIRGINSLLITGSITASGNISASGTLVGSNLSGINTGDQNIVNLAVTGSDVSFNHITASGNLTVGDISASGNIYGAMFKVSFGGYVRTTTVDTYYCQQYPGYYYWNTSLFTSIGSENFNSTTRYSQYIAEGGEKVNKVNGWIAPRRFNEESCSMYLWKVSPTDGAGGNITYTQMAPSQSFAEATPPVNFRIDMHVHPDSRSLDDGDALIFGFKRTTKGGFVGTDQVEYYDFNATIELEK